TNGELPRGLFDEQPPHLAGGTAPPALAVHRVVLAFHGKQYERSPLRTASEEPERPYRRSPVHHRDRAVAGRAEHVRQRDARALHLARPRRPTPLPDQLHNLAQV